MSTSAIVISLLVLAAASSGAVFKPGDWYQSLNRPGWTPPDWAFPVVWTPLYIMIGYAGWLTYQAGLTAAFALWFAQLVVNALWSYFFFGKRRMRQAFADMLLLLTLIVAFIAVTWVPLRTAALLFIPYGLWVSTAGLLNRRMIQLNPDAA